MAGGIPARLSRAEGRRFGIVVGAAFLMLGALLWWRGRPLPAQLSGAVGGALVLFGLVLPTALLPVQRAWMAMALAISKVTTPLILGAMYFAVITPIGMVRRIFGSDPMKAPPLNLSIWVDRHSDARRPTDMEHQF